LSIVHPFVFKDYRINLSVVSYLTTLLKK